MKHNMRHFAHRLLCGAALAPALAFALSFASCSGGDGDSLSGAIPTVHAVGYEFNDQGVQVVKYWTNKGDTKTLGDGIRTSTTNGNGIFVDDKNDVYCVGYQVGSDGYWRPRVWKNGDLLYDLQLTSGMKDGEAKDVFVRGNDVYVVGIEYDWDYDVHPALWKNRLPQPLGSGGSLPDYGGYGQADSVFVSGGGDVYVSGRDNYTKSSWQENGGYGLNPPTVWVNGQPKHLNDGWTLGCAFSVAVANNGVYAAGFEADAGFGNEGRSAKLWELSPGPSGSLRSTKSIGAGTGSSSASSVYASGSDVYIALWERDSSGRTIAKYYKNGALSPLGDGSMSTQALGISGHGGNVYVVGGERASGSHNVAKYWINGEPHTISSGGREALAFGIVVK
jgi:hypothetical protein